MQLVRGDDALDWRRAFATMGAVVLAEVALITVLTTDVRPASASPTPRILAASISSAPGGRGIQVSAQDPDAVVAEIQIDWGDDHRSAVTRGCRPSGGTRLYGGETMTASAGHPHPPGRVQVRAISRSCIQDEAPSASGWAAARSGWVHRATS